jgi:hypothetical protein
MLAILFTVATSSALAPSLALASGENKDTPLSEFLRQWIGKELSFLRTPKNDVRLFVRREGVRAFVHSELPAATKLVRSALSHFSSAAGLSLEFSNTNPNFIAVVTSSINGGDKPNPDLFRRLGMPPSALQIASDSSGWKDGCGIYTFAATENAQVALSLAFAEKSLSEQRMSDCLTEGVIRAFGAHVNAPNIIHSLDGYFQYLLLVKTLKQCDRTINTGAPSSDRSGLERRYLDCAVAEMHGRIK